MKESELRACADCGVCGRAIGNSGLLFFRVRVESWVVDLAAANRQNGLAIHMANAVLAMIMGPDEDMARLASTKEPA